MKKSSKTMVAVLVGASILAGVTAYAHRSGFNHSWKSEDHVAFVTEKISDKLDLDSQQEAHLQALIDNFHALRDQMRQDHDLVQQELLGLFEAPQLDQERLVAMVKSKTAMVDANITPVAGAIATFTDSLDAEQKQELVEMLEWRIGFGRHH